MVSSIVVPLDGSDLSRTALPVIADETLQGTVSIGAGTHGAGATVDAAALVAALGATVADVTDPETPRA